MNNRCIVTGGSGYIGSHVMEAIKVSGYDVISIDVAAESLNTDICNAESVINTFCELKPDFVFHLAAISNARIALENPVKAVEVNILGTANVLEASRQANVKRVVLASTCWVANAMASGILDENTPFLAEGGGHIYTTTKITSEYLAHDYQKLYGLPFTILRYGIPYGPRMWAGLVLRNFLDRAFSNQPLIIYGDGSSSRRFVFIEDLAKAHTLCLQDVASNQTYNLEGMRFVTLKELAELVSKLLGGVEILYQEEPSRVGELQYSRKIISNSKAYIDLGWEPQVDIEEGVRRTIEWYKKDILP
ncbi:MAG: NAD-dependent epimerase/dehydratase family protein [Nostocales cyanobacterium ELA583]|jgi:UDP-glucose 4-epimerase